MKYILIPKEMQQIERRAIQQYSIDGMLLMERAAAELCRLVLSLNPADAFVVCGPGNNGGDGLALARMLHVEGIRTQVRLLVDEASLKGDAKKNADILERLCIPLHAPWPQDAPSVVVDAVFGTGLNRAPDGVFLDAIERINTYGRAASRIVSVDIPSGLDGETGKMPGGTAVRADHCLTFQWKKRGHLLGSGRGLCGDLSLCSIGIPSSAAPSDVFVLEEEDLPRLLPPRPWDAHKNTFGHGLLIAGSKGMAGAALMAAQAALGGGIGLLSCACPRDSVAPYLQARIPSAMTFPLPECGAVQEEILRCLQGKTAAGIGPGLGRSDTALSALRAVYGCALPLVIDADALNLLSMYPLAFPPRSAPLVLTPHPGEAARLLGRSVEDPIRDALLLAQRFDAVCLLKGATTVIAAPDGRICLNVTGCSGLATGGSGDVLTGLLLSLLAQKLSAFDAACLAAFLHGRAGERAAARYGERSMNGWQLAQMNFFEDL